MAFSGFSAASSYLNSNEGGNGGGLGGGLDELAFFSILNADACKAMKKLRPEFCDMTCY